MDVRKTIVLLVLAALALPACGSSGTKTVVQTVTAPATAPSAQTEPEAESAAEEEIDCDALGINVETGNTGRCESDGLQFNVVNRAEEARLKSIAAKVDGVDSSATTGGEFGSSTAKGVYVLIALTVRNEASRPHAFSTSLPTQIVLGIDGKTYEPDSSASFETFPYEKINPGNSVSGSIAFDVPPAAVRKIGERGSQVAVTNFGSDVTGALGSNPGEVAVIRLWK